MKKIVNLSMREQIYEALKGMILDNRYVPKTVLAIDRLAEEFGVSATPVREALVRLEAEGLVELMPNKGARVTGISEQDVRSIWELRRLLEPYAARTSAESIDRTELAALEADIRKLEASPGDDELYVSTDTRLHELLYSRVGNAMLKDMIHRVHLMSQRIRFFAEHSPELHEKVVHDVIAEHLEILDAVRKGDPELVDGLLRQHLANGEKRTLSALRLES
ncbi:MAG: GntR family transcriptional regulator [Spirochaetales bacterium]|nr:GntR family transcriptional regulator [Spirochaetales bacterium]